jgi:predicted Rossmann-fold nucleotide-binding protein
MDANTHQSTAHQIVRGAATNQRIGILGSSVFEHPESESACREIGRLLCSVQDLTIITGGVTGVGERVSRSFLEGIDAHVGGRVLHLIPPGYPRREHGVHVVVGTTMIDRREVLARAAPVYICVEGGPGTAHEARVAVGQGAVVIPVGRFGGVSRDVHAELERPAFADASTWSTLADEAADVLMVAAAAASLAITAVRNAP